MASTPLDIELIINTADTEALDELRRVVAELRSDSHLVHGQITFEPGDATRFAREATLRGADLIVTAGGDGTLNEVVNGILTTGEGRPAEELPRLAIVPLGTANDFAGFIGIPPIINEALRHAVEGPERCVDVGCVNQRYFLNVSSGGLGAEATEEASDRSKRVLGSVAYFVTGVRKFAALRPSSGRFLSDGEAVFEGEFLFFAVGNGGRTGGGNWITPRASLTDGLLDVCIVEGVSHGDFLRLLPEIRTGDHLQNPHVTYTQLREITIEPIGQLSVNVDGEPVEEKVLRYSLLPSALRLAVSPSSNA